MLIISHVSHQKFFIVEVLIASKIHLQESVVLYKVQSVQLVIKKHRKKCVVAIIHTLKHRGEVNGIQWCLKIISMQIKAVVKGEGWGRRIFMNVKVGKAHFQHQRCDYGEFRARSKAWTWDLEDGGSGRVKCEKYNHTNQKEDNEFIMNYSAEMGEMVVSGAIFQPATMTKSEHC